MKYKLNMLYILIMYLIVICGYFGLLLNSMNFYSMYMFGIVIACYFCIAIYWLLKFQNLKSVLYAIAIILFCISYTLKGITLYFILITILFCIAEIISICMYLKKL